MARGTGCEPAADEDAAEGERDERDRGDRAVVHGSVCAAREYREDDDGEERDQAVAGVGDGGREHAAEPERLEHAPARPGGERADAVENDAEGHEEDEAPNREHTRIGGGGRLPASLEEEDERDA